MKLRHAFIMTALLASCADKHQNNSDSNTNTVRTSLGLSFKNFAAAQKVDDCTYDTALVSTLFDPSAVQGATSATYTLGGTASLATERSFSLLTLTNGANLTIENLGKLELGVLRVEGNATVKGVISAQIFDFDGSSGGITFNCFNGGISGTKPNTIPFPFSPAFPTKNLIVRSKGTVNAIFNTHGLRLDTENDQIIVRDGPMTMGPFLRNDAGVVIIADQASQLITPVFTQEAYGTLTLLDDGNAVTPLTPSVRITTVPTVLGGTLQLLASGTGFTKASYTLIQSATPITTYFDQISLPSGLGKVVYDYALSQVRFETYTSTDFATASVSIEKERTEVRLESTNHKKYAINSITDFDNISYASGNYTMQRWKAKGSLAPSDWIMDKNDNTDTTIANRNNAFIVNRFRIVSNGLIIDQNTDFKNLTDVGRLTVSNSTPNDNGSFGLKLNANDLTVGVFETFGSYKTSVGKTFTVTIQDKVTRKFNINIPYYFGNRNDFNAPDYNRAISAGTQRNNDISPMLSNTGNTTWIHLDETGTNQGLVMKEGQKFAHKQGTFKTVSLDSGDGKGGTIVLDGTDANVVVGKTFTHRVNSTLIILHDGVDTTPPPIITAVDAEINGKIIVLSDRTTLQSYVLLQSTNPITGTPQAKSNITTAGNKITYTRANPTDSSALLARFSSQSNFMQMYSRQRTLSGSQSFLQLGSDLRLGFLYEGASQPNIIPTYGASFNFGGLTLSASHVNLDDQYARHTHMNAISFGIAPEFIMSDLKFTPSFRFDSYSMFASGMQMQFDPRVNAIHIQNMDLNKSVLSLGGQLELARVAEWMPYVSFDYHHYLDGSKSKMDVSIVGQGKKEIYRTMDMGDVMQARVGVTSIDQTLSVQGEVLRSSEGDLKCTFEVGFKQ